ncbi:hypothetical protein F2Q70_00022803 [Brassica cretica]|uniref:mRNA (guanine-N(7))-methyltransferase n=1 Tax=Brassica cretica TaxID=69181 RepID=A0A8S9GIA8_BRACR|nr:hypothetical protein F2Q70_00022803 [Brassica cretica]
MKRGYSQSPSSSTPPPSTRFKSNPEGDSQFLDDDTTKNFARKVADHYSRRTNQTLEEREASPIIHLKKLNNWIKSVLIQLYARPDDAVLDLACGKGGDLIKWDKARIGYYVGIDIAEGSIEDCRTRYNGDADHHQRRKKFSFPSRLLCGDCFEVELDKILEEDAPFDICSCQFAMHYSWTTFVSSHHGKKIENADYYCFSDEPEISKGPVFGPPTKAEVSEAAFMGVSSISDAEVVLDDSDSPVSVESCLAMFTKPEILSEENAWHCENCSTNLKLQRLREKRELFGNGWVYDNIFNQSFTDFKNWDTLYDDEAVDSEEVLVRSAAIKRVLVNKAPPVLTIHLKRFSQDAQGRLSKLRGHVAFNEFIDLGLYMDVESRQDEEDQPVYMLAGLVEHSGTMGRGHYVAYIRGDDKERRDSSVWYRASDSFVRQVSFEEVLRSEAYILFYQRI